MILTNTTKAIAALRTIIDGLPRVVEAAFDRAGRDGLNQLHATSQFTNRTWQLNSAFRYGFTSIDDTKIGVLDIDPGVIGIGGGKVFSTRARATRKGDTPPTCAPAEYGYFLQWGTKFMAARPFMTDVAGKVAFELPLRLTDGIADLFNGS